jgi:hypothetical protein
VQQLPALVAFHIGRAGLGFMDTTDAETRGKRATDRFEQLRLAIAVRLFASEKRRLPRSLSELVPEYIEANQRQLDFPADDN